MNHTHGQYALTNHTHDDYLTRTQIIDLLHPIGSIYSNINNTNPSTLFEGTTWTEITNNTQTTPQIYTWYRTQ